MKAKNALLPVFAIIIIILILFVNRYVWFTNPNRDYYVIRGIDVSHHQGNINWEEVSKDDVGFAYIKASEANDFKDTLFGYNWEHAHKNKIPTGAYHFYSLAYDGEVQAKNFISEVPNNVDQLPPVIDLEYVGNSKKRPDKPEFQKELDIYISLVSTHYGKSPILYTTYDFYNDYLYPEFKDYKIWIRDIFSEPDSINWSIWQYNPRGSVKGIKGDVDLNVLSGDLSSL